MASPSTDPHPSWSKLVAAARTTPAPEIDVADRVTRAITATSRAPAVHDDWMTVLTGWFAGPVPRFALAATVVLAAAASVTAHRDLDSTLQIAGLTSPISAP